MRAPGSATATVWPAATLGAPQTIVRVALADVDRANAEPVGVGMLLALEHLADDEARRPTAGPTVATRSTSVPVIASRSASSCGVDARVAVLAQP